MFKKSHEFLEALWRDLEVITTVVVSVPLIIIAIRLWLQTK